MIAVLVSTITTLAATDIMLNTDSVTLGEALCKLSEKKRKKLSKRVRKQIRKMILEGIE